MTAETAPDLVTPEEAIQVAFQWHKEGRMAEARILYERVLDVEPDNQDAMHFLGLLLHQLGTPQAGIDLLRKAVEVAPGYVAAHSNLGNMLLEQGDLDGAEHAYRQALEQDHEMVEAKNNLGLVLERRGCREAAERIYREAIAQAPEHPMAYNNLGQLLAASGNLVEGVRLLERAVALHPEFADAYRNLGHALTASGRKEAAVPAYRKAVELGADAYLELATALREQGLLDEAIAAYRKVLAVGGRQASAFHSLGMLLGAQHREEEAIEVYRQWLRWDPDNPVALHLLAACRQESAPARASDGFVEAVFDGFAPAFDQRLSELEYRAPQLVAERLQREVVDAAASKLRILDAGCGTGLCAPLLRPYASSLIGVDLSAAMLEIAHERGGYDQLIKSELTAFLEGAQAAFDLIVSADTLVYFGDLAAVFRACEHALTPGGNLIATLEYMPDEPGPGYHLNTHGRYSHSLHYLQALCDECGLTLRPVQQEVLRQEMGQPVMGFVICAYTQTS